MALKLYNETDIEAIADAIRGKNGSSDTYKVSEMADAIDDIPTGGGGSGWTPDEVASATGMSGNIEFESDITTTRSRAFYGATALTGVASMHNFTLNTGVFSNCTGLVYAAFPNNDANFNSGDIFNGCTSLKTVDWGPHSMSIGADAFRAPNLENLILRRPTVASLGGGGTNVFRGCTNIQPGGSGVSIYIPKTLYDSLGTGTNDYKAATNWSVIDGYGTVTWKQIEGSQYESKTWWKD